MLQREVRPLGNSDTVVLQSAKLKEKFPESSLTALLPVGAGRQTPWVTPKPCYLFCDSTGTFYQLPLGVAVCRANLESSSFLDKEYTAMAKLLHPSPDLEPNLDGKEGTGKKGERRKSK